ncbi:hypothetical protein HUU05_08350 [candidate division KSB1 bacterium]|nr:hypothetical protein [candidate division KSB1 bacterium]
MKRIFIDSWAWVALVDQQDSNHERADQINERLLEAGYFFATSNFVFGESLTTLRYKVGYEEALRFHEIFTRLIKGGLLKVLRVTEALKKKPGGLSQSITIRIFPGWIALRLQS